MHVGKDASHFDGYIKSAESFWRRTIPPAGESEKVILCDMFHHDARVAVRGLMVAKAVQHHLGGQVQCLGHANPVWDGILRDYSAEKARTLCEVHLAAFVDCYQVQKTMQPKREMIDVLDRMADQDIDDIKSLKLADGFPIGRHILSTFMRISLTPVFERWMMASPEFLAIAEHTLVSYAHYTKILKQEEVQAFVTSHVDYSIWGMLAEMCLARGITIYQFHTTHDFKIFVYRPEDFDPSRPPRYSYMKSSGQFFQKNILPYADAWSEGIKEIVYRNKLDLNRPSWWLNGAVSMQSSEDRAYFRRMALSQMNWDNNKPTYCLFLHSLTDALWNNEEAFDGYFEWIEETLKFAAQNPQINWLIRNHPSAETYDKTDQFHKWMEKYQCDHIQFSRARQYDKNMLWSICDLGITVRGSISNELAVYGIPVLQAGHSEMSGCGFSKVASTKKEYFDLLKSGNVTISDAEIHAARVWMYFYRELSSVKSIFLPGWNFGARNTFFYYMRMNLSAHSIREDPLFNFVATMIDRGDPTMLRYDMVDSAHVNQKKGLRKPEVKTPVIGDPMQDGFRNFQARNALGPVTHFKKKDDFQITNGLSQQYDWGFWTTDNSAVFGIETLEPFSKPCKITIQGRGNVYSSIICDQRELEGFHRPVNKLKVDVLVDDVVVGRLLYDGDLDGAISKERSVYVPLHLIEGKTAFALTLRTNVKNRSPKLTGVGPDTRALGMAISRVTLEMSDHKFKTRLDHWHLIAEQHAKEPVVGLDNASGWGCWTVGDEVFWYLRGLKPKTSYEFQFSGRAWLHETLLQELNVGLTLNGEVVKDFVFSTENGGDVPKTYTAHIGHKFTAHKDAVEVGFQIDTQGRSPQSLGLGETDMRRLGLALSRWRIREKPSIPRGEKEGSADKADAKDFVAVASKKTSDGH